MPHTPGPWDVAQGNGREVFAREFPVAYAYDGTTGKPTGDDIPERAQANARLIAAAPELLEALEAITATSTLQTTEAFTAAIKRAEAAIRKAKGDDAQK